MANYSDGVLMNRPLPGLSTNQSVVFPHYEIVNQFPSPSDYAHGLAWGDDKLWLCGAFDNTIYQLGPVNGAVLNSYQPSFSHLRGMAWDGTYLWVSDWSTTVGRIYKLNPNDGAVIDSFLVPYGEVSEGIAWANGFLWVSGDTRIYKVNPIDGSVVDFIDSPEWDPRGLTWDGQYLWVGFQDSGMVYQLNVNNGDIVQSFLSPAITQQGLAFDGQYLWVAGDYGDIYQLSVKYRLSITLDSLTAKPKNGKVEIEWETATEENNAYFRIARGDEPASSVCDLDPSNYENVGYTSPKINSQGTSVSGASYRFTDMTVTAGTKYCYALIDVDYDGTEISHLVSTQPVSID